jgi:hypothetical protein
MPWDESRLAAVEASARECPDACGADVVSLVAEVARLTEQVRIARDAITEALEDYDLRDEMSAVDGLRAALTRMSVVE